MSRFGKSGKMSEHEYECINLTARAGTEVDRLISPLFRAVDKREQVGGNDVIKVLAELSKGADEKDHPAIVSAFLAGIGVSDLLLQGAINDQDVAMALSLCFDSPESAESEGN